jgi:SM-20-related protein
MDGIAPAVAPAPSRAYLDAAFGDLILNIDRLRAATLSTDPFDFLYVPGTIDNDELVEIVRDFPDVPAGGSFDVTTLQSGPAFQRLIDEIRTDAFRAPFEDKFGIDLSLHPLHITVRGHVRGKDGAIHTDSKDKILTGLLYLNLDWNETGGRLRLLRDGKNIDAYALEIPPVAGNMVVFRRGDRSWHGHLPSKSRRLALQFNWVSGDAYVRRELARHRFSGWMKRLSGAGS